MENTEFEHNQAFAYGSGVYASGSKKIQVLESKFLNHTDSEAGGAFYVEKVEEFIAKKCEILDNQAQVYGGAMYFMKTENILIQESDFEHNILNVKQKESKGGCMYIKEANDVQILKSNIKNSKAFLKGGALYLNSVLQFSLKESVLEKNCINFDDKLE